MAVFKNWLVLFSQMLVVLLHWAIG